MGDKGGLYRAALIGCGRVGSELADDPRGDGTYTHAEAYSICPDTQLVAVCDTVISKLERCAKRWNVTARYDDPSSLLAQERPDIVSICTPDATHHDLVRLAILTPGVRAILAEKPLAVNLEQAKELVRLAVEREVVLAVNCTRRYAESHIRLKSFVQSGGIGAIQTVGGYYTKGTLHNGIHWFDLARFLVGEVSWVWGADVRKETRDDPTLDAFLEFECGAGGHLQGCDSAAFDIFEMDLIGTQGRVRLIESGHEFETYSVADNPRYSAYRTLQRSDGPEGGLRNAIVRAVEDLVRCLKTGGRPRCSGEDGVAALEIALAVVESAGSGLAVALRRC